jgi:ubiquinone/menaquinone biosynthesis C-methylase UbiE
MPSSSSSETPQSFSATPPHVERGREPGNNYMLDPNSAAEIGRLVSQDRMLNHNIAILPEEAPQGGNILDVACGPGGWLEEVLFHYPEYSGIGVDISENVIHYARETTRSHGVKKLEFHVLDVTDFAAWRQRFATNSMALVQARFMVSFLKADQWLPVIREMVRVAAPGGVIRLIEHDESGAFISNSPALEEFRRLIFRATSTDNRLTILTPMLTRWLRQAGCTRTRVAAHLIDFSYGQPFYEDMVKDLFVLVQTMGPFIRKACPDVSQEHINELARLSIAQMYSEDFCGLECLVEAVGVKPA